MSIKAHFADIGLALSTELAKATHCVNIAVAWFTDIELISVLEQKAKAGIPVKIVLSNVQFQNKIVELFTPLINAGGLVYLVGSETNLMHHKFCVIDYAVTITGSYNWSSQAKSNYENIVVIEDTETAILYTKVFNRLMMEQLTDISAPQNKLVIVKAGALRELGIDVNIAEIAATI